MGLKVTPRGLNEGPKKENSKAPELKLPSFSPKKAKKELGEFVKKLNKVKADVLKKVYDGVSTQKLSQEDLFAFSESSDWMLRAAVAKNPRTAGITLNKLAEDKKASVRKNVAENPSVSNKAFKELSNDKSSVVRVAVASSNKIAYKNDLQNLLAKDKSPDVRKAFAGNKYATESALMYIHENDKNVEVLDVLESNGKFVKVVERKKLSREARKFMDDVNGMLQAKGGRTDPDFLFKNAHSEDEQVRRIIAAMSDAPANLLKVLAQDKSALVRASVASNANVPQKVVTMLRNDPSEQVRFSLVKNVMLNRPAGRSSLVAHFVNDKSEKVRAAAMATASNPSVLDKMSRDKSQRVRMIVAGNWNSPRSTLRKLSKDEAYEVRRAVAINEKTPRGVLATLATDENVLVAQAAIENNAMVADHN
jgi:hypothetical protein